MVSSIRLPCLRTQIARWLYSVVHGYSVGVSILIVNAVVYYSVDLSFSNVLGSCLYSGNRASICRLADQASYFCNFRMALSSSII